MLPVKTLVKTYSFQSLDYDNSENYIFLREERLKGLSFIMQKNVCRWIIFLCIGIITAFVGIFIDVAIEEMAKIKYSKIKTCKLQSWLESKSYIYTWLIRIFFADLDDAVLHNSLCIPFGIWIAFNIFPVLIGSLMVVYIEVSLWVSDCNQFF